MPPMIRTGAVAALALLPTLIAQTVVAPAGYAATEGNANNTFPWSRATASMRIQFCYDSSHFTSQGVTFPIRIDRLRYRREQAAATTTWAGGTWPQVQIDMSTSAVDYLAVTSTFASNHGGDRTTVHSGPVTVQAGAGNGANVPGPWYISIPVTPFTYDPTSGNDLLIDIMLDGTGWSGTSGAADHVSSTGVPAPLGSRVYDSTSNTPNGATGVVATNYVAVCEFSYQPAAGLHPAFTATPTTGASPLFVQFTDTTFTSDPGGVLLYEWDFDNDGTIDSNLQNPSHTYTQCGVYSVRLRVTDAMHGQQTLVRTNYISTDAVTASFTRTDLGGGRIQFTDTSTPTPTSWAWDFDGDNVIDSTLQNPVHTFPGVACYPGVPVTTTLNVTLNCRSSSAQQSYSVSTGLLTTLSTANNGLTGANVGVFFDLAVSPAEGVTVCSLDVMPYSTAGAFRADVYVTPGTHVGSTGNAALWRLVASGLGTSVGGTTTTAVLTNVTLNNPIHLPQGSYGVAVYIVPATGTMGHAYVTGTGPNQNHSNGELSFVAGGSTTALFPATLTTPRVWCGRIYYSKCSTNDTPGYGFFGAGCAGTMAVSRNVATTQPILGTTMSVGFNNLPIDAALVLVGFSRSTSPLGPLPLNAAPYGAPGCFLRVSPDSTLLVNGSSNAAVYNFGPIPNRTIYLCNQFYVQAIVFDPSANAAGVVASDSAAAIIGR